MVKNVQKRFFFTFLGELKIRRFYLILTLFILLYIRIYGALITDLLSDLKEAF